MIPNALVPVAVVRSVRGMSAEAVVQSAESGALRWVWDVSSGQGQIMALRFWSQELNDPAATARLDLPEVIARILGARRQTWRGTELAQLLIVSRPQIHRLHKRRFITGNIANHTLLVSRAALETFLTTRWLGGQKR
jgi:hypothetical protein